MVLPPDEAGEQVVERGDRPAPLELLGHLQPLGVLVEHRVDDVDERLVAVEDPVAAGEGVALEPALAEVLGEHLHDPPARRQVVVALDDLGLPGPVGDLQQGAQAVRHGLVGAHDPERRGVAHHDVLEPAGHHPVGPRPVAVGAGHVERRSRGSRAGRGGRRCGPRWPGAWRPSAARPPAPAGPPSRGCGPTRRTAPRACSCASTPRASSGARRCRARPTAAPGASATCPRPAGRRPPQAPSTPWGCAARASATAGGSCRRRSGRRPGTRRRRRASRRACRPAGGGRRPGRRPTRRTACARSP